MTNSPEIRLLALGAAKRVTFFEQFSSLVDQIGGKLVLSSMEIDQSFYPIACIAEIINGPKFSSSEFPIFLEELLFEKKMTALSFMDTAIPALSRLSSRNFGGGYVIASSESGANIALNKISTNKFCIKNDILHPNLYGESSTLASGIKLIAKPIKGFGSKGISCFNGQLFRKKFNILKNTHIIQEYVEGIETTHDLYIFEDHDFISVSRDRLSVNNGEVEHCLVRESTLDERSIFSKITSTGLFRGPMTIQTIKRDKHIYLIEINARFGGGVTASIKARFPILQAWFKDSLGIELPSKQFRPVEMKRCYRDFYRVL